jgi:hypothetical protein
MYAFGVFKFHPLQSLTGEQFFQSAEEMPRQRRKQLGVIRSENTFEKRINRLIKKGYLLKRRGGSMAKYLPPPEIASRPQKRMFFSYMDAIGLLTY